MRFGTHIALIIFVVTFIYLPITGHQLITDDFTRISDNSNVDNSYLRNLLTDNKTDGFYRPINHLSFGVTYWLFGLNTYAYGLFNYLVLMTTCLVVFCIIIRLTGDMGLATLLVVAWLANVKVVASTIVWAVGRTSGLEMLFASCATLMVVKANQSGRWPPIVYALAFTTLALLSKEGAVVLGPLLLAITVFNAFQSRSFKPKHIALLGGGLLLVYLLYFFMRHTSGAMTPDAAPDYYRWRLSPSILLRNLGSYLERSIQFSIVFVPLMWLLAPKAAGLRPSIGRRAKWAALFLALFAFTISLALPVPSRSNLYPYCPSIFVVGAMAALMGYNPKVPQFGLSRRKFFLTISLFVLIASPISWMRGHDAYLRHGHTIAWANAIAHEYGRHGVRSVCIKYDPAQDSTRAVDRLELHFLMEALKLKHVNVDVFITDECRHQNCIVFGLERKNSKFFAGDLVLIEAKMGEPSAAAYGLPPAAEP